MYRMYLAQVTTVLLLTSTTSLAREGSATSGDPGNIDLSVEFKITSSGSWFPIADTDLEIFDAQTGGFVATLTMRHASDWLTLPYGRYVVCWRNVAGFRHGCETSGEPTAPGDFVTLDINMRDYAIGRIIVGRANCVESDDFDRFRVLLVDEDGVELQSRRVVGGEGFVFGGLLPDTRYHLRFALDGQVKWVTEIEPRPVGGVTVIHTHEVCPNPQ